MSGLWWAFCDRGEWGWLPLLGAARGGSRLDGLGAEKMGLPGQSGG